MDNDDQLLRLPNEDPLAVLGRLAVKLNTLWLKETYPFARFGRHTSIHYSCDIQRATSRYVDLGEQVYLAPDVWLNIVAGKENSGPRIVLGLSLIHI